MCVEKLLCVQAHALSMGHIGPCPPPYFWKYLIKIPVNAVKVAFWPSNSHFWGQNNLNIAKFRWLLGLRPRLRLFLQDVEGTQKIWPKVAPPLFWGQRTPLCVCILLQVSRFETTNFSNNSLFCLSVSKVSFFSMDLILAPGAEVVFWSNKITRLK